MIYVMLPAYNEEKALPLLLEAFATLFAEHPLDYCIVVVDDGSYDSTADIAERYAVQMPLVLIKHGINKGLGAAMRSGFQYLARVCKDNDLVVTMDADNTHNPATMLEMIEKIAAGYDIVIASRYAQGGKEIGLQSYRKLLSRGASLLLLLSFPISGVQDYTCGYRLYRAYLLSRAFERYGDDFIVENSFVCMAEILIKLAYLPAKVTEVPLVLRYDLKEGASKMKKIRTILRYLRFIGREKLRPLKPIRPSA